MPFDTNPAKKELIPPNLSLQWGRTFNFWRLTRVTPDVLQGDVLCRMVCTMRRGVNIFLSSCSRCCFILSLFSVAMADAQNMVWRKVSSSMLQHKQLGVVLLYLLFKDFFLFRSYMSLVTLMRTVLQTDFKAWSITGASQQFVGPIAAIFYLAVCFLWIFCMHCLCDFWVGLVSQYVTFYCKRYSMNG